MRPWHTLSSILKRHIGSESVHWNMTAVEKSNLHISLIQSLQRVDPLMTRLEHDIEKLEWERTSTAPFPPETIEALPSVHEIDTMDRRNLPALVLALISLGFEPSQTWNFPNGSRHAATLFGNAATRGMILRVIRRRRVQWSNDDAALLFYVLQILVNNIQDGHFTASDCWLQGGEFGESALRELERGEMDELLIEELRRFLELASESLSEMVIWDKQRFRAFGSRVAANVR